MKVVIIGNNVAGTFTAQNIRLLNEEVEIEIFTQEKYPYYTRVRLPELISEKISIDDLIVFNDDWYKNKQIKLNTRNDTVGCAIQMFRRKCYEEIGGYLPLKIGGEDAAAEILARMKSWEVRAFPELEVLHNRAMGSGIWNVWESRYYAGVENYHLGYHPLFFLLKSISRITERPAFFGSILMLSGYLWSSIRSTKRMVSDDFIQFLRNEQRQNMKSAFIKLFSRNPKNS